MISSRTPEGPPDQSPICRKIAALELCYPGGDAVCPSCGHLLWSIRGRIASNLWANLGVSSDQINFETLFRDDLGVDSLDRVEFTTELDAEFETTIPDTLRQISARWAT